MTKIFHPNVAVPSGEICVNTLKKDWNPSNWSLSHIFEVVKCLLIVPFPESSLNEEAGREFMESYEDFFSNARLYTSVHARPTQEQQKLIEQHMASHYKAVAAEERKQEQESHQFGQETTGGVLSQLTNSFLPTTAAEGKGENFACDGMPTFSKPQSGMAPSLKKVPAAADPKKKWMRRI
jgi:Ubiquitin-conjugating enzyme